MSPWILWFWETSTPLSLFKWCKISTLGWQEVGALKAVQDMQYRGSDVIRKGSNAECDSRFRGFFLFQYFLNFCHSFSEIHSELWNESMLLLFVLQIIIKILKKINKSHVEILWSPNIKLNDTVWLNTAKGWFAAPVLTCTGDSLVMVPLTGMPRPCLGALF